MLERDENGVLHIVAISGGKDSTVLSLALKEKERGPFNFVCTPTGNELPEMFDHWKWLGSANVLGKRILPIMHMGGGLVGIIREQGMIPNHRARFCTRALKIEPYREFLQQQTALGPVVSYVGLRADEEGRAGGAYSDIDGVTMRFPLREWGWGLADVLNFLEERGITIPIRTDCAMCYHQRLIEWWRLWKLYPKHWVEAVMLETEFGHSFRSKKIDKGTGEPIMVTRRDHTYASSHRDTWPAHLEDMQIVFEAGHIPPDRMGADSMAVGACRACSL